MKYRTKLDKRSTKGEYTYNSLSGAVAYARKQATRKFNSRETNREWLVGFNLQAWPHKASSHRSHCLISSQIAIGNAIRDKGTGAMWALKGPRHRDKCYLGQGLGLYHGRKNAIRGRTLRGVARGLGEAGQRWERERGQGLPNRAGARRLHTAHPIAHVHLIFLYSPSPPPTSARPLPAASVDLYPST